VKSEKSWKKKRECMEYYNVIAESYNQLYGKEQSLKYEMTLNFSKIAMASIVLDLGCGTGLFIKEIAEKAGFVVGIDLSRSMIEIAKKDSKDLNNVFLICGDANHLSLRDDVIEKIFSFTLLQNLPNLQQAVEEMMRVAKVDSELILSVDKKSFTLEGLRQLLKENLKISNFIVVDAKKLKDYLVICRNF